MAVAKNNRRIPVTVPDWFHAILKEVAKERNMSMSALAADALIEKYGPTAKTAVTPPTISTRTN